MYDNATRVTDGCCGGPAPEGAAACCLEDAEAKAAGAAGCGCQGSSSAAARSDSVASKRTSGNAIRQAVRDQYSQVAEGGGGSCGVAGSPCCGGAAADLASLSRALGYSADETGAVPNGANLGLGCGNPQAIAGLRPGETVLDLGSGAGFDCFLAAGQVGSAGLVIGVDMTPAMIAKARTNAANGDYLNVDFRLGEIESLPVADGTVDVIISNCVINLCPDKRRVFEESYRVLRSGGRLAIADIVASAGLPEEIREDMSLLTGCMAGASLVTELEAELRSVGFEKIRITPRDESKSFIRDWAPDKPITDYVVSATIEAVKPVR
jgi:SAM-dependent methyltransferase